MQRLKKYKPTKFMADTSRYDKELADSVVFFIEQLTHTKGKWKGKSFELLPWQEQIIRDVFGIVKRKDGNRQFKTVYIEIPKKQGKSELAAAVALYLLFADGIGLGICLVISSFAIGINGCLIFTVCIQEIQFNDTIVRFGISYPTQIPCIAVLILTGNGNLIAASPQEHP